MGLGHLLKNAMNGLTGQPDADQEARDQAFLQSLLGQSYVPQASDLPPAPASGPHARGQMPIEGPQLPEGMVEPNPAVGPTDTGLPGGGPYNPKYLDEGPMALVDAKKQAAAQLFEDPAKTLNVLIEARKKGAGPGVGGILEYMVKEQQRMAGAKENQKKADQKMQLETKRMQSRTASEEAKRRLQEKLAGAANATRERIASMRGKKGALDEQDLQHMTDADLDALESELTHQDSGLQAPDAGIYDSYDDLSKLTYREDYRDFSDSKTEIGKLMRALGRVRSLRKKDGAPPPGGGGGGAAGGKLIDANTIARYVAAAKQAAPQADKKVIAQMAREAAAKDGYNVGK